MNAQSRTCRMPHAARRTGFTLIELLVVISVMVILFTIALPSIRSLTGSGQSTAAVNTFSAAVAAARTYAGINPVFDFGSYSGCAIIVDTAGQLRLTINAERFPDNYPYSANQFLQDTDGRKLEQGQDSGTKRWAVNGYVDVAGREYFTLPRGTGLMGIVRGGTGTGEVQLLHPPFAVRFNAEGTYVASKNTDVDQSTPVQQASRVVCYDGNRDSAYIMGTGAGSTRANPFGGGTYDYAQWDPESSAYVSSNQATVKLPFEKLESVAGIVAYSKTALADAGLTFSTGGLETSFGSGTAGEWIMNNGIKIFINRYTGALNKVQ